ncbi:MAG: CDGSH iron-sulfur domain-containing protein [Candidatus Nitrosopolaris sp.]
MKVAGYSTWICMCGLSNNQPFCDDSHKKEGQ